jgi:hypothetical protein
LVSVQLSMGSAYNPQSDGQTERVNQCMETYLRVSSLCPRKWVDWLPLAMFWYNTGHHSSIDSSSFEALYGHSPHHFGVCPDAMTPVGSLNDWLQERKLMTVLIKQHLNRVVLRMKHQSDKKHSEHQFDRGDLVFFKLQPYVQSSLDH